MDKIVKGTLYYMIGLFVYLFSQWLMSILVVRLSGSYEEAGVFATALSVTNVFFILSSFSLRNFQVADINDKFSKSEYLTFRLITCALSVMILPVYLLVMNYSTYTFLSVMGYMVIKVAESVIDVLHGSFQKIWRLDIICKSYVLRGIVNLAVFSLAEFLFKNLVLTLFLTGISSLICAFLVDVRNSKSLFGLSIDFKNKNLIKLLKCGLPLFINGLLSTLIYNVPRIAAQKICGEELFGFYASVAAPTVVIQLAVSSVFSPCITTMSEQYQKRDKKLYMTIFRVQAIIILIGIVAVIGFGLLGNWFLEIMFGEEILNYGNLLVPAVIAAGLISITAFVSAIFTVTGHNVTMVVLEAAAFITDLILSIVLIDKIGLQGINYSLIFSCLVFIIIGYFIILPKIKKNLSTSIES